jgi:F-type H+-transporting ATPase subunit delta
MKATARARRTARRLFRVCVADGLLNGERVRQVAHRLAASQRRDSLAILVDFRRLVRLDRDLHTATIESVLPLPSDLREEVRASLAHLYGPGLEVTFEHQPALIGGVRITVGSDVYDGSVRARLEAMAARL